MLIARPDQGFNKIDTGVFHDKGVGASPVYNQDASSHLADVNGDGVADLIQCTVIESGARWTLNLWTPAGPGFDAVSTPIDFLHYYPCTGEVVAAQAD